MQKSNFHLFIPCDFISSQSISRVSFLTSAVLHQGFQLPPIEVNGERESMCLCERDFYSSNSHNLLFASPFSYEMYKADKTSGTTVWDLLGEFCSIHLKVSTIYIFLLYHFKTGILKWKRFKLFYLRNTGRFIVQVHRRGS